MTKQLVQLDQDGPIAMLTMQHAAKRNVLSRAMLTELRAALGQVSTCGTTKCAILRAEGPAFCAGHDLREVADATPRQNASLFSLCTEVMQAIRSAAFPVIAQVQGIATAAGCQLAATCDLVIASSDATFATPGVKIGLFCSTPAVALSRAVPEKKALEMLFTGTPILAVEAEKIGLVNRVVSPAALQEQTLALARQIADASGETLALGKRVFYRQLSLDCESAYDVAQQAMVENAALPDAAEGMHAFLEKRPAKWRS